MENEREFKTPASFVIARIVSIFSTVNNLIVSLVSSLFGVAFLIGTIAGIISLVGIIISSIVGTITDTGDQAASLILGGIFSGFSIVGIIALIALSIVGILLFLSTWIPTVTGIIANVYNKEKILNAPGKIGTKYLVDAIIKLLFDILPIGVYVMTALFFFSQMSIIGGIIFLLFAVYDLFLTVVAIAQIVIAIKIKVDSRKKN